MSAVRRVGVEGPTGRLIESVLDRAEGGVRAIAAYRRDEYEILYMPGDVEDQYTEADFDRIYAEMRYEAEGGEYVESLYRLGEIRATIRLFEAGTVVNVVPAVGRGVLVSIAADADPGLRGIVEACDEWMAAVGTEDSLAVVGD